MMKRKLKQSSCQVDVLMDQNSKRK